MKKASWALGIIVLIAALFGAYTYIRHTTQTVPAAETSGTGNAAVGANGASAVITYTDTGFSPSPFTIAVGTTITWVNQSSHKMAVTASTNKCGGDGSVLISNGGTFSFTFSTVGTFPYMNCEAKEDTGTIVVTEASASGPINPNAVPE